MTEHAHFGISNLTSLNFSCLSDPSVYSDFQNVRSFMTFYDYMTFYDVLRSRGAQMKKKKKSPMKFGRKIGFN